MTDLIASETLKLRTLWLPRVLILMGAALSGVIGFAVVRTDADAHRTATLSDVASAPSPPMWFIAVVVAVLATAGEFQHRTIRTTLLHTPRRGQVLAVKAAVSAAYGASLAAIGTVTATTVGALTMRSEGIPVNFAADLLSVLAASTLLGALWSVLATGLGMLVRNSTLALVGVLVWTFVVENVIPIVTNTPDLQRWMPSSAASAVMYGGPGTAWLPPIGGALLFVGYAGLISLGGAMVFLRRDPN